MTHVHEEIIKCIKEVVDSQPIPPHYNPNEWKGKNFNCYAYAMRICIDFCEDELKKMVIPGFLSKTNYQCTKRSIIKCFKNDCKVLGLKVNSSSISKPIKQNEYKIAVYIKEGAFYKRGDFHFARQDSNGKWTEKDGWWDDEISFLKEQDVTKEINRYKCIGIFKVSKK